MSKHQRPNNPHIRDHQQTVRYMRTPAAAVYTGVPASTLTKLRMRGGGPTYCKVGHSVVYDVQALDEWLAAGRRTSTSAPAIEAVAAPLQRRPRRKAADTTSTPPDNPPIPLHAGRRE